ncbi:hypothetical protein UFOVP707_7 [uncultured Caudovirales phage]|uniref:Uncharacterized protein n=1 Tax=uncultured Caudovirales phage TaxID=2100421 RepID=A0A6J5NI44_9CAUD|nr:hypothetical protein UFOVP707_7 [uncultured Caudovirales phage]
MHTDQIDRLNRAFATAFEIVCIGLVAGITYWFLAEVVFASGAC